MTNFFSLSLLSLLCLFIYRKFAIDRRLSMDPFLFILFYFTLFYFILFIHSQSSQDAISKTDFIKTSVTYEKDEISCVAYFNSLSIRRCKSLRASGAFGLKNF